MYNLSYNHPATETATYYSRLSRAIRTLYHGHRSDPDVVSALLLIKEKLELDEKEAFDLSEFLCRGTSNASCSLFLQRGFITQDSRTGRYYVDKDFDSAVLNDVSFPEAQRQKAMTIFEGVTVSISEGVGTKSIGELVDEALSDIQTFIPPIPFRNRILSSFDNLDVDEKASFLLLCGQFVRGFTEPLSPTDDINNPSARVSFDHSIGSLIEKGLAVSVIEWKKDKDLTDSNLYRISPKAAEIFKGLDEIVNLRTISSMANVIPCKDITEKELFFPASTSELVSLFELACNSADHDRIVAELKKNNYRPTLSALLHGCPGTGKTESVLQIARKTGHDVIIADTPKIQGIYVGENGINLRNFFQIYRYICAVSSVCPILLMDEADGLLGKRATEVRRAYDKDSNMGTNIILEELNTLPGIFVATTNLVENLDDAMARRFLMSISFPMPDEETRQRLWAKRFPWLRPSETLQLAQHYPMSGGEMDNIASMAILHGILRNERVTFARLLEYNDKAAATKGPQQQKIGF